MVGGLNFPKSKRSCKKGPYDCHIIDQKAVSLLSFHSLVTTWWQALKKLYLLIVCVLLTSCSCSTAGRELATWTGTHVGSGTKAIATWIPANCWREEEEEEDSLLNWFNRSQWFVIKQTETEISYAYLLSSPLGFGIKEDLRMEELTNDTLVPSWQSLPAGTAVWMEARATHIGPDRDKKEKNK